VAFTEGRIFRELQIRRHRVAPYHHIPLGDRAQVPLVSAFSGFFRLSNQCANGDTFGTPFSALMIIPLN
jgi:hypothetical protein